MDGSLKVDALSAEIVECWNRYPQESEFRFDPCFVSRPQASPTGNV